jgi:AcrR family transcriptional regulator
VLRLGERDVTIPRPPAHVRGKSNTIDIWIPSISNVGMAMRLRRAEQVERNRTAVLDAARHVFLDRGYGGATVDAIAEEAGFSKGVVYSQFGSKADMFMALLERRITERGAQNERAAAGKSVAEGARELIRLAARDAVSEQGWAQLLVEFRAHAARDPVLNRRYADAHRRTVTQLAGILGRLHDRAGISPSVPPQAMAEFVLAIGTGVTLERAANPAALPADHLGHMMASALDGLAWSVRSTRPAGPGDRLAAQLSQPASATAAGEPDRWEDQ